MLVLVGAQLAPACPRFSARLFGPLAFSGFRHRSSPVLSANFTLHHGLVGARKKLPRGPVLLHGDQSLRRRED